MLAAEANALVPAPVCLPEMDRALLLLVLFVVAKEPNPPPLVDLDFFFSAILRLLFLVVNGGMMER